MKESVKVNPKYVKETIHEYNKSISHVNETEQLYSTIKKNGGTYYIIGMTKDEFRQSIRSINIDDIKWV